MEILRIEEEQHYGYQVTCGEFKKFFDDAVTGSKEQTLKCLITYLNKAPKLFPTRPVFQSEEFTTFVTNLESTITVEFAQFSDLHISGIVVRTKIKDGSRTSFWEITVIDQNKHTHKFDYNLTDYPTKPDAITQFNKEYNLNLTYED